METAEVYGVAPYILYQTRNRNPTWKYTKTAPRLKPHTISPEVLTCRTKTGEDASLNPTGREVPDSKNKGTKLMNCKKYLQIGTFNARTLRNQEKRLELAKNLSKCKLSILGIVHHKIVHEEDPIQIEQLDNCTLITSAWRNTNAASAGGVGVFVNNHAEKALAEIKSINSRIMAVVFSGNPNTTVVVNYAPVEGSEEENEHYEALTNVINDIPKHHVIIECGDYNAHLGEEKSVRYIFHERTNNNGKLLLEHATECDLHTAIQKDERKAMGIHLRHEWEKIANRLHLNKQKVEKLCT